LYIDDKKGNHKGLPFLSTTISNDYVGAGPCACPIIQANSGPGVSGDEASRYLQFNGTNGRVLPWVSARAVYFVNTNKVMF
jgi:hypothetical protein